MATERKTVVTLHKGVDSARFMEEMTSSKGTIYIPDRKVELYNEKKHSISNVDFVMPADEAQTLLGDPRVRDVRWGTKKELGIVLTPHVIEPPRDYSRNPFFVSSNEYDWAKAAMTSRTNRYGGNYILEYAHQYTLTGKDVDIVIQDAGVQVNHPDFWRRDRPISRFKLIDWPVEAGMTDDSTQDPSYYSGDALGHGTHVASSAAGLLYGWAKDANLFSMIVLESPYAFGVSESFNLLRGWHENKSNGNPSIVNMSWGYSFNWDNYDRVRYRKYFVHS